MQTHTTEYFCILIEEELRKITFQLHLAQKKNEELKALLPKGIFNKILMYIMN